MGKGCDDGENQKKDTKYNIDGNQRGVLYVCHLFGIKKTVCQIFSVMRGGQKQINVDAVHDKRQNIGYLNEELIQVKLFANDLIGTFTAYRTNFGIIFEPSAAVITNHNDLLRI
jgi:hypothetical protein